MMNGHGKSDDAIVAGKPANKADQSNAEQSVAERFDAEPVERRAEAKGNTVQLKHAPDTESGERVTSAGTYTASSKGKA